MANPFIPEGQPYTNGVPDSFIGPLTGNDTISASNVEDYLNKYKQSNSGYGDQLINYYLSEKSANTAREWQERMDSSKYQRMVADLKAAGLNPYWIMNDASGTAGQLSSSGNSYSGSSQTSAANNTRTNMTSVVKAVLQFLGKIVSAGIMSS